MMKYKGYVGVAEIDLKAKVLRGHVINTSDVITFQSPSVATIEDEFRASVDFHLEFCAKHGITPRKSFGGKILLRTDPELQEAATLAAAERGESVNAYVNGLIRQAALGKPPGDARPCPNPPVFGESHVSAPKSRQAGPKAGSRKRPAKG